MLHAYIHIDIFINRAQRVLYPRIVSVCVSMYVSRFKLKLNRILLVAAARKGKIRKSKT